MKRKRLIIYTPEQLAAIAAVEDAGADLAQARLDVSLATEKARSAVRDALLLGVHYKELKGLNHSFTYRVLQDISA